jgi:hypothetical protein
MMETIREAVAIAEPTPDMSARTDRSWSPVTGPAPTSNESDLGLRIRMTASSLAGIALIDRHPDSESTR